MATSLYTKQYPRKEILEIDESRKIRVEYTHFPNVHRLNSGRLVVVVMMRLLEVSP